MSRATEKLAGLFALGILLLDFPVLAIFQRAGLVGGLPAVYLYLFGVWAAGIVAVFLLARGRWDGEA